MLKLITQDKIPAIIFLVAFVFCKFIDVPSYISAIFSITWFFYVPFIIGNLILKIPIKYLKKSNFEIKNTRIAENVIRWIIGTSFISVLLYVLFSFHIDIINILGEFLLFVAIAFNLIFNPFKTLFKLNSFRLRVILIVLVLGTSFGLYIRSYSPYPLSPGIDVFNHIFTIKSILNNSLSDVPLVYLPTFDMFITLGSSVFNADLNSVFWIGSIFLCIVFSFSWYVMSYYFLRNHLVSVLGTIISLSITEMGIASNLQYYYPASFIMCIYPLMFFVIDNLWKRVHRDNFIIILILTLDVFFFLYIMHSFLGLIVSVLLSLYIFCSYFLIKKERLFILLRFITLLFALLILGYYFGNINFQLKASVIENNLFESHHLYNTITKIMNLNEWYTEEIMILSILGSILLSFFKDKRIVVLNFISIITLLIYFQSISDIHRIMPLERSFISLSASMVIIFPIVIISKIKKKNKIINSNNMQVDIKSKKKKMILYRRIISLIDKIGTVEYKREISKPAIFYIIITLILLFPVLLKPYDLYIGNYLAKGFSFTNYTYDELNASKWIESNIPKNYKIYSDPLTVVEFRGLSYKINIEGIGWNTTVASQVKTMFLSENASFAYHDIYSKYGKNVVIVITPRTTEWLNSHLFFIQDPINDFKVISGFYKFFDNTYFEVKYYNNKVIVFTLK
jgi:hypothetical protein